MTSTMIVLPIVIISFLNLAQLFSSPPFPQSKRLWEGLPSESVNVLKQESNLTEDSGKGILRLNNLSH